MRYRAQRHYLYPVLRPGSDDYGETASFRTTLEQPEYNRDNGMLTVALRFDLKETGIYETIRAGKAQCAAMVYCGSTLFRTRISANREEPFLATGSIQVSRLKNRVEVHPVILATQDIPVYSTRTANREYERLPVEVNRFAPLATDQPWHFDLEVDETPVRSIFRIRENDSLQDGEFDLQLDPGEDYVDLLVNPETRRRFNSVRSEPSLVPSLFMSAVTEVLAFIKDDLDEEERADSECAWVQCVQRRLHQLGVDIGGKERQGQHSPLLAAQRILNTPFEGMLRGLLGEESEDIDEETSL